MSKIMKAAVAHQFGQPLVIEKVPIPEPESDQVLVRIIACGVCHSDLHLVNGDWPLKPELPIILGHEGIGYVTEVGSDVNSIKEGDLVGIPWLNSSCGCCEYCTTGWETLCPSLKGTACAINGPFAEYALIHAAYAVPIPPELDPIQAAPLLCAGVTTYKGLRETETKPGDWVVISGIGGLGHVAVQYAKAMGLHVIAVDVIDDHLTLAWELGADLTINASKQDPGKVVQDKIGGVHGALVTAVSTSAFHQAISTLRPHGTCVVNGLPPGEFSMPIWDLVLKRITIRGSIVGTRQDMRECLQLAAEGKIKPKIETQPLEAINEVFDRLRNGKVNGRVVLQIGST